MKTASTPLVFLIFFSRLAFADSISIDEIKKRHSETLSQFGSLYLNLEIVYDPAKGVGAENVEFWKDGDEFRIKITNSQGSGGESEIYVKGNIQKGYELKPAADGSQPIKGGGIYPRGGPLGGDPFLLCIFNVPGNTAFRVPFHTVLEEPHELISINRQNLAGNFYSTATIQHKKAKFEARFSESQNFLIDKLTIWQLDQPKYALGTSEVSEFRELSPGVFFPYQITTKLYASNSGELLSTKTVKVKNAKLNIPISKENFKFSFPPNILVTDAIKNKVYFTDDSGDPTIEARNSEGKLYKLIQGPVSPKSALSGDTQATEEEPVSYFRWLFYASIILSLMGILMLVYRKAKKA